MENEIKVNDYVRMIDGLIAKIVTKDKDDHFILDRYYAGGRHLTEIEVKNDIVKHSPNLIDLIQCGDYVNGKEVSNVDKVDNINFIEWTDGDMYKTEIENDKFIKTIVTKEQFESISYKVERNN